ncbi:MAG: DUF3857 domain-containing protein [Candidatus Acidiferrum sp.]
MSSRRILLLFVPILLCALYFPSRNILAGDDWLPIDPADLKMTTEPKAPGAPAIYLYRQVDRKESGRANHTEAYYFRVKILTEDGRKYGNIEIPYLKSVGGISNIRARTIHPDGTVLNFDGKIFENTIVKSKTLKYQAKTFTMPDVQVGSIVEYRFIYDLRDNYVFRSYWTVSADLFTRKAVFSFKPYENYDLQWNMPAGLPAGTVPPKSDQGIIRMTSEDVPAFQTEDFMPPEHELKFEVNFVYSQDGFEKDPDRFWKKYGKKHFDETEKFMDKRKAMEQAVAQIISPSDPADTKLRKIYARCQQVKNLNFEKAQERASYQKLKNDNVEDVWKNQVAYGGDINLLFLALVRAAGFEGYYVRLSGRSEYFFKPQRMNTSELDADAVLVKSDGKDIFLDPATKFAPYGLLPWPETGVTGLRLDKQDGTWVQTPIPDSAACKIIRQADLTLTDDGALEGTVTETATGLEALRLRLSERFNDDTQRKENLEEGLKYTIPVTAEVELKNQPDWNSSGEQLVFKYDIKIPGWATSAGKRELLPLGLFSGAHKHTFEHAQRTYAIYFPYYFQTEDRITIKLPAGWKVESLPKETHVDAKAAEYRILVASQADDLQVTRTFRSDILLLQQSFYPTLRTFYQQMRSGDDAQAVLQPGASSAAIQ